MGGPDMLASARTALIRMYRELELADTFTRAPDEEDCQALMARIGLPGRIREISYGVYWHFLSACRPRLYNGNEFCVQLGDDPMALFWRVGSRCFCRQLTWPETRRLCQVAGLPFEKPGC
jgi:hypothetical protein